MERFLLMIVSGWRFADRNAGQIFDQRQRLALMEAEGAVFAIMNRTWHRAVMLCQMVQQAQEEWQVVQLYPLFVDGEDEARAPGRHF